MSYYSFASDKRRIPMKLKFEHYNREDVLSIVAESYILCLDNNSFVREVKINGRIKTWKRDPDRIEVSYKYGLYEYGKFNLEQAMSRFVHQVEFEAVKVKEKNV